MQVEVAETGPCSRTVHVTVPPALVDEHLAQMYASAQSQVQMKGFRPGKVPRHLIQKHFGQSILVEAKEQLLNRYFGEACRNKDLSPVGRIAIDDFEKIEIAPGSQLEFTAKIDVRPVFELKDVKGLQVDGFEGESNDGDVDSALEKIAHEKRSIQKTDEPAKDGDFVRADLSFVDGSGKEVLSRRNVQLNTRIAIHGIDETAFSEALLGAQPDRAIELPIKFPDTFEKTEVRGQDGVVKLKVGEVLRVAPPAIDDQFAKGLGFEDLATLRSDLSARISEEKKRLGLSRQEDQCLQQLLDQHDIPVPPSLVEEQKQASLNAFEQRMREAGAGDDEVKSKLEESADEAQKDALRRVRLFFLIEAVA
jgi:trigger factor